MAHFFINKSWPQNHRLNLQSTSSCRLHITRASTPMFQKGESLTEEVRLPVVSLVLGSLQTDTLRRVKYHFNIFDISVIIFLAIVRIFIEDCGSIIEDTLPIFHSVKLSGQGMHSGWQKHKKINSEEVVLLVGTCFQATSKVVWNKGLISLLTTDIWVQGFKVQGQFVVTFTN